MNTDTWYARFENSGAAVYATRARWDSKPAVPLLEIPISSVTLWFLYRLEVSRPAHQSLAKEGIRYLSFGCSNSFSPVSET